MNTPSSKLTVHIHLLGNKWRSRCCVRFFFSSRELSHTVICWSSLESLYYIELSRGRITVTCYSCYFQSDHCQWPLSFTLIARISCSNHTRASWTRKKVGKHHHSPHRHRRSPIRSSVFIWKGRKRMAAATENVTLSPLLDTIDVLNQTNGSGTGAKEVFVARTDGMLLSYSFLLLAALLCVYFGSYRSVTRKDQQTKSGEKPDVLTAKDGNQLIVSFVFTSTIAF